MEVIEMSVINEFKRGRFYDTLKFKNYLCEWLIKKKHIKNEDDFKELLKTTPSINTILIKYNIKGQFDADNRYWYMDKEFAIGYFNKI